MIILSLRISVHWYSMSFQVPSVIYRFSVIWSFSPLLQQSPLDQFAIFLEKYLFSPSPLGMHSFPSQDTSFYCPKMSFRKPDSMQLSIYIPYHSSFPLTIFYWKHCPECCFYSFISTSSSGPALLNSLMYILGLFCKGWMTFPTNL